MSYSSYQEFRSLVKTKGLIVGSHYSIILPQLESGPDQRDIAMQCEMASLPGINIMTSELRAFGEVTEYSYGVTYAPVSLTFFLTSTFDTRAYFSEWMSQVYNTNTRTAGFYRSYVKPLTIMVQDKEGNEVYKVVLHEAFPKTISDMALSYGDHDPLKLNVMIQYKWWSNNVDDGAGARSPSSSSDEGLGNLTGVAGGFNVSRLASIGSPFNTNLPTSIGSSLSDITNFLPKNPFLNVGAAISQNGPIIGADIASRANACSKSVFSSVITIPGQATGSGSSSLGSLVKQLGSNFNNFGGNLTDLGKNLTQLTEPVAALRGTIGTIANTTNQLDSLARSLGIDSGLGKISQRLSVVNAKLNVPLAKISTVVNGLSGVGASMTAIDTSITVISKSIEELPNVAKSVSESLSKLGNIIGIHGSNVNNMASELSNLDGL